MANLLSSYKQGENRVTASILAVFERLSIGLLEKIFQNLFEVPEKSFFRFQNQPKSKDDDSVPDAVIQASFSWWIETKCKTNSVRESQIRNHLAILDKSEPFDDKKLLVFTPDFHKPAELDSFGNKHVVWKSFCELVNAIEAAIDSKSGLLGVDGPIVSEREFEILNELVRLFEYSGLTKTAEGQVVIVAASAAIGDYEKYGAYIYQSGRTIRATSHMGFYVNGGISRVVPRIRKPLKEVVLSESAMSQLEDKAIREDMTKLVASLKRNGDSRYGEPHNIMLLTHPEDPDTVHLESEIINNQVSDSGRGVAFTQGQRYVALDELQKGPKTTSELLKERP